MAVSAVAVELAGVAGGNDSGTGFVQVGWVRPMGIDKQDQRGSARGRGHRIVADPPGHDNPDLVLALLASIGRQRFMRPVDQLRFRPWQVDMQDRRRPIEPVEPSNTTRRARRVGFSFIPC